MNDKRELIRKCGKKLFSSTGYRNTNVADITKMAGMATGTFYNHYLSKDVLFMDIFLEENVKLKKKIMKAIDLEADPMQVMQQMMLLNNQGMLKHPILREWYNREIFMKIEANYRVAHGIERVDFLYDEFIVLVRKWQNEGKMRSDIEPEMIMAIFSAIIAIDTHKDEIGLQFFPEIMEYIASFTMKGLMDIPKEE